MTVKFTAVVIEESMKINLETLGMLLSLLKETYHILLSSITTVLYIKEIFENWTRVVNKNKNTKSSKQVKTAGDSTEYDKDKA